MNRSMLLTLLRQDRAWRALPHWLPFSLVLGALLFTLVQTQIGPSGDPEHHLHGGHITFALSVIWGILPLFFLYAGIGTRAEPLALGLPVSSRRAWVAHVAALILATAILLGVGVALFAAGNLVRDVRPLVHPRVWQLCLAELTALTALLVLLQRVRPSLQELPLCGGVIARMVLLWALGFILLHALMALPAAGSALALLVALGALGATAHGLPPAWDLVGRAPDDRADAPAASPAAARGGPGSDARRVLWRTIFHTVHLPWLFWPMVPMVMILTCVRPGYFTPGLTSLAMLPWLWVMLTTLLVTSAARLRRLAHLPIARARLFALAVLPILGFIALGYGLNTVITARQAARRSLVVLETPLPPEERGSLSSPWPHPHSAAGASHVRVPYRFWEIGTRGALPAPRAPWGEAHPPAVLEIFRGSPRVLYLPFTAPAGSSPEYVAWQLARASERVYGAAPPVAELAERYLVEAFAAGRRIEAQEINLREDYPHLRATDAARTYPVLLLLAIVPWLLFLALVLPGLGSAATLGRRILHTLLLLSLAVPTAGWLIFLMATSSAGLSSEWRISAYYEVLVQHLTQMLPQHPALLWLVALGLLAGAYAIAQARFARIDLPLAPRGR